MQQILEAIQSGARPATSSPAIPLPETYRAAVVRPTSRRCSRGSTPPTRTPARSLHVGDVATPELAPDEVYVAVMASSINFNTVWTSIFEPLPTFGFLDRLGRESAWGARHDQPYHVVGSDASGVVLRVGSAVRNWKPGDRVVVHCNYVDDQDPSAHDDSMLAGNQRIWGFETNFGGLADLSVVKANQLMPKPAHLSWEEAAVNALCNSTSYRMLVSRNAARMKQGDAVLIWGATGGLGGYAVQYVLNGGGIPVGRGVVAREGRAAPRPGLRARSSTARPPATGSGRTSTPRTSASGAGSARTSGPSSATTPTSCSSTRAARPSARRCSSPPGAAPSSPARRRAAT